MLLQVIFEATVGHMEIIANCVASKIACNNIIFAITVTNFVHLRLQVTSISQSGQALGGLQ